MILQVRQGKTVYEVKVPRGSRIQTNSLNLPVLIIPGPRPQDTSTWLPAAEILDAARIGLFGMGLRSERQPVACG